MILMNERFFNNILVGDIDLAEVGNRQVGIQLVVVDILVAIDILQVGNLVGLDRSLVVADRDRPVDNQQEDIQQEGNRQVGNQQVDNQGVDIRRVDNQQVDIRVVVPLQL